MAKPMYALLNSNNHDSNLRKEPNNTGFKALKLRLMNPSAFEKPNYQILFFSFLFIYEKEENALGYSPKTMDPPSTHIAL